MAAFNELRQVLKGDQQHDFLGQAQTTAPRRYVAKSRR